MIHRTQEHDSLFLNFNLQTMFLVEKQGKPIWYNETKHWQQMEPTDQMNFDNFFLFNLF